jgi:ubiquinone/menaquinone biosynthesis C-methylase UbiE
MLGSLRRRLAASELYSFNVVLRDRWIGAQAARVPTGSRVLDVGAGSAPYRKAFAHCEYLTQDFTQLQPDQLRHGGYAAIDYVCDAAAIPVPDASFDAVLCTEMLEHVPDPIRVVRELGRILKPEGLLILTAPLGSGIHQEPFHFYGGYTPYWYQRFLPEAGFDWIQIESNAGSLRFFGQESIRFLRSTRPFALRMPLVAELLWAPLWLLAVPVLGIAVPAACAILDRFDRDRRFTVGYHVTARRARVELRRA